MGEKQAELTDAEYRVLTHAVLTGANPAFHKAQLDRLLLLNLVQYVETKSLYTATERGRAVYERGGTLEG